MALTEVGRGRKGEAGKAGRGEQGKEELEGEVVLKKVREAQSKNIKMYQLGSMGPKQ